MGREQQTVGFADREQRIARFEGLVGEDIETRSGQLPGVEGCGQRRFVDDSAAGDVDEYGRGFHQGQFPRTDQSARAVRQRGVDRHHVGPGQQFVERQGGVGLLAHDARYGGVGDLASQRFGDFGDIAPDVAQSDDAPFRSVELVGSTAEMVLQGRSGVCGFDVVVVIDHLPQQSDGRADGGFRHGVGRVTHGVLYGNALVGGRVEVDVVHARRRHADQPQAGKLLQRLAAENHFVGNHHVGFAAAFHGLFAGRRLIARVIAQRTDGRQVGASERVFV